MLLLQAILLDINSGHSINWHLWGSQFKFRAPAFAYYLFLGNPEVWHRGGCQWRNLLSEFE